MTTVVICAGGPPRENVTKSYFEQLESPVFIGADAGAKYLLEQQIIPDYAVGDFDSLTTEEWEEVSSKVKVLDRYHAEKDMTDTEIALEKAISLQPTCVIVTGVTGGRLDHYEANLHAVFRLQSMYPHTAFKIVNSLNEIQFLTPGEHILKKNAKYKYLSFFAFQTDVLNVTLKGVKYETVNETIHLGSSRFTSNEFVHDFGSISFTSGICLVIRSTDD